MDCLPLETSRCLHHSCQLQITNLSLAFSMRADFLTSGPSSHVWSIFSPKGLQPWHHSVPRIISPALILEYIYIYQKHPLPKGAIKGVMLWYLCLFYSKGVPGLHTQKMVAIGSAVFALPGNRQTDRRWMIVRYIYIYTSIYPCSARSWMGGRRWMRHNSWCYGKLGKVSLGMWCTMVTCP